MSNQTAMKSIMDRDNDRYAAKRTADQICNILRDFIPDYCRKDAWDLVAKVCHEHGIEMTSKDMRKEYEAWKQTQIDGFNLQEIPKFLEDSK